jgi:8-oxo-dGTP pyrophosphatase MutT (NUDIX family)
MSQYQKPIKKSYGVACCRYNTMTRKMEILMVKKRYTFYYVEFILGHYTNADDIKLPYLFNRMSNEEKLDIESCCFERMWARVWREVPTNQDVMYAKYIKCKRKFDNCFTGSCSVAISELLSASTSQDPMWEIPKGRKDANETELGCAIRELREETELSDNSYYIIPGQTIEMRFTNRKAQYISKFFIAIAIESVTLDGKFRQSAKLNFANHHQLLEVIDVRWINLDEMKFLDSSKKFYTVIDGIFRLLRTRYRVPKLTELKQLHNLVPQFDKN